MASPPTHIVPAMHPDTTETHASSSATHHATELENEGIHADDHASVGSNDENVAPDNIDSILGAEFEPTLRSRLLDHKNWDASSGCGSENCNHGAMSPRPWTHRSYGSIGSDPSRDMFPTRFAIASAAGPDDISERSQPSFSEGHPEGSPRGRSSHKRSTTAYLMKRHGIRNSRYMYVRLDVI